MYHSNKTSNYFVKGFERLTFDFKLIDYRNKTFKLIELVTCFEIKVNLLELL